MKTTLRAATLAAASLYVLTGASAAFAGDPFGLKAAGKQIADDTKKDVKDTKQQAVDSATAPVKDAKDQVKGAAAEAAGTGTAATGGAAAAAAEQREKAKGTANGALKDATGGMLGQ